MDDNILRDNQKPQLQEAVDGKSDILAAIVIPVRLDSARLPGKALLEKTGRPLFAHTVDQALKASRAADVGIITDSRRVHAAACQLFVGKALPVFSDMKWENGSQRVVQWVKHFDAFDTYDVVVDLQCDEPCIDPRDLDRLILACSLSGQISTLVTPLPSAPQKRVVALLNQNIVKALRKDDGIIYFKRACTSMINGNAWEHIGAYAFPQAILKTGLLQRDASKKAKLHNLEQLTWLDAGEKIFAVDCKYSDNPLSINTGEDYAKFCKWFKERKTCEA